MEKLQFQCQHCSQRLRASARRLGETVNCPKCGRPTTLLMPGKSPSGAKVTREAPQRLAGSESSPSPPPMSVAVEAAPPPPPARSTSSTAAPSAPTAHSTTTPPITPWPTSHSDAPNAQPANAPPANAPPANAPPVAANVPLVSGRSEGESVPNSPTDDGNADDEAVSFAGLDSYDYGVAESEWVVETHVESERDRRFDPEKVAVPRRILYYQGALLAITAAFAFVLGMVFGRSFAPSAAQVAMPTPCSIKGKIEFTRGGLNAMPDEGSIVIAVPRDYKPDQRERWELEQIGSASDDRHPSVDVLRSMGGDFAITDRQGRFQLELPDQGRYYLLVLSANSQRPGQEELNRLHLAEMGAYFGPAQRLIGDRRFHWRTENFNKDQELSILF
ncbi:MAG: hypothetical protein KDB14_32305 [Planctomycetales bacterium]|nr:hypothetical protein [Planctomycetales bacterium]